MWICFLEPPHLKYPRIHKFCGTPLIRDASFCLVEYFIKRISTSKSISSFLIAWIVIKVTEWIGGSMNRPAGDTRNCSRSSTRHHAWWFRRECQVFGLQLTVMPWEFDSNGIELSRISHSWSIQCRMLQCLDLHEWPIVWGACSVEWPLLHASWNGQWWLNLDSRCCLGSKFPEAESALLQLFHTMS